MLCPPALIYLVLAGVGLIWSLYQKNTTSMVWPTIFIILWTMLLNYVCKKSLTLSWILLFSPLILFVIGLTIFMSTKHT